MKEKSDVPTSRRLPLPSSGTLLRVLTHTQNASALVFSLFLSIHLAAPLAAALGSTPSADAVMLLGREYYLPFESIAVYAPLGVHVLSSILKRLIMVLRTRRVPHLTPHAKTGYALLPLVLPHLLLHRIIPSVSAQPIAELSPSEFGFQFVGYAAESRAWMSVGYAFLTGVALSHAVVGSMKVLGWARAVLPRGRSRKTVVAFETRDDTTTKGILTSTPLRPGRRIGKMSKIGLGGFVGTIVSIVIIGLWRLARDAGDLGSFTVMRYDAVFSSAPWARIGLR